MPIYSAENTFRKGLEALADGNPAAAAELFQSAILIEVQHGVRRPQMRYLSFYGLSRAQAQGATPQTIQACETAARRDFFNPDLLLNLGRVFLLAGKTTRAMAAFQRGLELAPRHKALLAEHGKIDRREPPPLAIVAREHPLNKMLGKLRWSLRAWTPKWMDAFRVADRP
jgi:tetratricopeptide (TPR) repeat protein